MLDTNPTLHTDPTSFGPPPISNSMDKQRIRLELERRACQSLREVLQLKLQQRRTREELVSQGIMPPLKSPAAFHEQRRSLERARTEDYLKRKIRSRPERSELVRMHILEETSVEPSLQAKQLQLKRARLADDLNDKISHRPGPMELIHKNILPVHSSIKQAIIETDFPKVAGEISSFDEDSSDTLSPEQPIGQESPLGHGPLPSPPDALACNSTPTQFLTQVPPPPPPLPPFHGPCQPVKLSNGTAVLRTGPALIKFQPKPTSERPPQRSKKPKDNKPKVRKLKYHQYIPPDQKADHEPPPQLDSTYAKILHQQQLFLQLQILNQQQQHYNYHTILPAPPKPLTDQPPPTNGPSPSPAVPAPSTSSSSQSAPSRQNVTHVGGATLGCLPPNLDDLKVAELKHELKLRSLPVSGTKNDLIERLRNYQAQQNSRGGGSATTTTAGGATGSGAGASKTNHPTQQQQKQLLLLQQQQLSQHQALSSVGHQSGEAGVVTLATFPFMTTAPQQIMHFGSTSSSPPVSPAPSDRSLAGMSPDETSCNGDSFGEMVSSPLTQLSLHPSPQHLGTIKEELSGSAPTACQFSMASLQKRLQVAPPSVNKDQMLQEKDKQIEALTCMLRQKQRLVETLRVQLEQGKRGGRDAPPEPLGLVRVKEEPPDIPSIPSTFCPIARSPTPSQCHMEVTKMTIKQEVGDVEEAVEPSLEAPPQQVQLEQIQAQQRSQLEQLKLQQMQQINALQLAQQQALQQLLLQQNQQNLQKHRSQQRKKKSHKQQLKQQQQQLLSQQQQQIQSKNQQLLQSKHQHQQILQAQQQQQQLKSQQVSQMFLNQQSRSTTSFPLDLLKTHSTPTLVTDSNGNHFLIALTNHCAESQGSEMPQGTPQGKASNRIILQRLQSTPTKLPSQSPLQLSSSDTQSKPKTQPGLVKQPTRKGQKAGLQVSTNHSPGVALSFSAPPNLQPFFPNDDSSPSEKDTSPSPPAQTEDLSPGLDHEPLFSPPSPKQTPSPNPPDDKDNGSTQHMDDLFDILIQTGEISATFKPAPDPSLARLRPNTPSPSRSQAPSPLQLQLHFSPPTPPEPETPKPSPGEEELQAPATDDQDVSNTGSGRLEDFLESTTGKPLLGVEPGGPLTLIDDLHSQMLSTPSILDHTSSPMDTYELSGYTANPPGLNFGDHALDSMDWLDITMGGASNEIAGLAPLGPLGPHTPPSVFSADFLDSSDLQLHWDSCL
ncbi:myocardin-related transcription factor A isoform X5 [Oncorhynchus mykiss]|uniref:myocardin-related transcription factor A isoform X5 n=1 Tax=Oncorhynchus mykiss TaxID=8022 RepID=UPI001878E26E|nr:myocardin-related transcription factor A isoform X5 [Oncorhynchus mykiss]